MRSHFQYIDHSQPGSPVVYEVWTLGSIITADLQFAHVHGFKPEDNPMIAVRFIGYVPDSAYAGRWAEIRQCIADHNTKRVRPSLIGGTIPKSKAHPEWEPVPFKLNAKRPSKIAKEKGWKQKAQAERLHPPIPQPARPIPPDNANYPRGGRRVWLWHHYKFHHDGQDIVTCCHCNRPLSFNQMSVEHLKPLALGGTNHKPNLRPSCLPCNNDRPCEDISHQFTTI